MHPLRLILLSFIFIHVLYAQDFHPVQMRRGDSYYHYSVQSPVLRGSKDTIKVLALMVQFKQDSDPRTSGNGRFQIGPSSLNLIDSPPHNAEYFSNKLRFLENYYRKVSNNQLIVRASLFPGIVTLSDSMGVYSAKKGETNAPLARLIIDSWTGANQANSSFPFSQYQSFIVFHAGVGRDIDLVGRFGFDPTPSDIPSIFMNLQSLRSELKDPAFAGIAVSNGSFRITNSLVLPSTETRITQLSNQIDTLQLSSNGMIVATFGSYLGLPDLFNTKTGKSGIGQFGLMDGASIFAYNGLFPPEPSAWEKFYLGWVEQITLAKNTSPVSVPAVGLTSVGKDTVYRIPINSREYFLVENRQRDPHGNGQTLTIYNQGAIIQKFYAKDTSGFNFADVRAIGGVVVDVEDFDWALPGSMSQKGFEGGGILIWHINENVISEKIQTNEVNADPTRRGVRLVEADGSRDIGELYEFLQAGGGTENGWPLDAWFEGNQSPVYKNIFNERSFPNSNTSSGIPSLITLKKFSVKQPRMTFDVEFGNSVIKSSTIFAKDVGQSSVVPTPTVSSNGIFLTTNERIYVFNQDGSSKTKDQYGLFSEFGGTSGVAVFAEDSKTTWIAGATQSQLLLWKAIDSNLDGKFETVDTTVISLGSTITTNPSFLRSNQNLSVIVGTQSGDTYSVNVNGSVTKIISGFGKPVSSLTQLPSSAQSRPYDVYVTSGGVVRSESFSAFLPDSAVPWIVSGIVTKSGKQIALAEKGGARVQLMDHTLANILFSIALEGQKILSIGSVDILGDGNKEIVLVTEWRLHVLNQRGSHIDNFPIEITTTSKMSGGFLLGDVDNDGQMDVVLPTNTGELLALSSKGRKLNGLNFQANDPTSQGMAFFRTPSAKLGILSQSSSGGLKSFELQSSYSLSNLPWTQYLQNEWKWNADTTVTKNPNPISSEFFPRSRVYNWPNPVYGNSTQIRYYVSEDADIVVRIFDIEGKMITELNRRAQGGTDDEITWEILDIQSGVYLARVSARSATRTETAIIKIAVVR